MSEDGIELTRRKVLSGLATVGAAGAGVGTGTSALFSDQETVEANSLVAGELDLKVDWEEHYYNGGAAPANGENVGSLRRVDGADDVTDSEVGLPDPENPIVAVDEADLDEFMQASTAETGGPTSNPDPGPIELSDVKPGDFGEVTFSYRLLDNPGYVTLEAAVAEDAENGVTEPEKEVDSSPNAGELGENVQAALWYDPDCDNVLDSEESPIVRGTLNEVLASLGADPPGSNVTSEDPMVLNPTESGGRVAPDYTGTHCHGVVGSSVDCSEKFYFTNVEDGNGQNIFGTPGDDATKLYRTNIDSTTQEATVTELFDFESNFPSESEYNHIVSIAASADGERIYVIDKFSNHLGVYNVPNSSFEDKGPISGLPSTQNNSLQSAVSPDGALYFTVGGGSNLYVIEDPDANTPSVDQTIPLTEQDGSTLTVGGSDIAFLSNGTLYLIDSRPGDGDNTAHLYKLPDPSTGRAEFVADLPSDASLPGIAVRASGTGNLIGIDVDDDANQLYEIDPADGSRVATYPAVTPNGNTFEFADAGGDMTVGPLCPKHCVALAWWVPRSVGNEIQSDRFAFDVTFRAEQCRNNVKLVNHWPLESVGDGTADDVVGAYDGTVNGSVSPTSTSQVGTGAASFDDGYVALPGFPNLQSNFTISAWIRTDDRTKQGQRIFADDASNTEGYAVSLGDGGPGKIRFYSRALDSNSFSSIILDTGNVIQNDEQWYHVVVSVDTDQKKRRVYVDGALEADDSSSYSKDWGTDSGVATIGGEPNSSRRFDGVIDDVRIYDRRLSDSEVTDLYNATK